MIVDGSSEVVDRGLKIVRRQVACYAGRVQFEIVGEIRDLETIASGRGIRIYSRLVRRFGRGNWRKMKGFAAVRLASGRLLNVELHWYEAHGIGKRGMKIKRYR